MNCKKSELNEGCREMKAHITDKRLNIGGMHCINCQNKIEQRLRRIKGIKSVRVSYRSGFADISYDPDIVSLKDIADAIEKLDYRVLNDGENINFGHTVRISAVIVLLYLLLQKTGVLNLLAPGKIDDTKTGYGMLFVIGLVTSVHCIAMCGGINLSQCISSDEKSSAFKPSFLYNLGRVTSYTLVGGVLGFVGFIFGGGGAEEVLPVVAQGMLKIIAGIFMVIFGINMLGIYPALRKLQPRLPNILRIKPGASPLFVGLLNGLMPCGPLQSMQLVALASGNPISGALSMFLFSMGTVPLMFGFGSAVSALGKKFKEKITIIGAVLVVVLGLAMLSQGGSMSGLLLPETLLMLIIGLSILGIVSLMPFKKQSYKILSTLSVFAAVVIITVWNPISRFNSADNLQSDIQSDHQIVESTLTPGSYPNITVQVGTPVKWIINAPRGSINGCNYRMNIYEYEIYNYALQYGENVIEFTPTKTGRYLYTCWMGMIRGTITVTDKTA
jgi:sulfite exporter TauE/SafE/copper chaperone CopZ